MSVVYLDSKGLHTADEVSFMYHDLPGRPHMRHRMNKITVIYVHPKGCILHMSYGSDTRIYRWVNEFGPCINLQ